MKTSYMYYTLRLSEDDREINAMIRVYTCIYTCVQFNIKGLIDCLCSMWTSIESFVYVLSLTAKSIDIL